jgi:hypothetical protein
MHHEVERLVDMYDGGGLSRRQLLKGLLALSIGPHVVYPLGRASGSPGRRRRYFTRVR